MKCRPSRKEIYMSKQKREQLLTWKLEENLLMVKDLKILLSRTVSDF
jgi:hypothetical protein